MQGKLDSPYLLQTQLFLGLFERVEFLHESLLSPLHLNDLVCQDRVLFSEGLASGFVFRLLISTRATSV